MRSELNGEKWQAEAKADGEYVDDIAGALERIRDEWLEDQAEEVA